MRKEEKDQLIDELVEQLNNTPIIYVADTSELNAEATSNLRRMCFKQEIKLTVVKNTLLKRAMEKSEKNLDELYSVLKGPSSLMFSEVGNAPAKLIKEFRKTSDKPVLKGAYVEEMTYLGEDQLEFLVNIKSRDELIGDLIALLQSPAKNVISALQSGGQKLSGILKTLSEKDN
ncbi:MAG TPA: 50S ribosomal protein L10 [Bacteroidales bacterium]|nr:50S ribosomal protein L10 [Bacteroidales bacterium]HPE56202.1 50S ribosomal protein L10 [Bacteroidales bacterium]HRX96061.1 50S ribosomal protein L10 [Bacteroidales bacterium]